MPKKINGNQRECSNCHEHTPVDRALILQHGGRIIAVLCEDCQQAHKIQITIERTAAHPHWKFFQFFPLEA